MRSAVARRIAERSTKLSFKHALLGLLAEGPLHGYELKTAYETQLVPAGNLNFGQVYTTLERLNRDGLVSFEKVNQAERPDKKVYKLTAHGRRELKDWLTRPSTIELDQRNSTFLKLMLARRLGGVDLMGVLAAERRACFERLHEVTRAKAQAQQAGAPLQSVLLLDLAVLTLEAFLKWLDRCEAALKQETNK
ncbi:MAG: PadR family transcriptional regulator [Pirellulales bacterium]